MEPLSTAQPAAAAMPKSLATAEPLGAPLPEGVTTAEQLQAPVPEGLKGWWQYNFGVYVIVDRYANFIGSISGIILSCVLLAIWLVIGRVMGYDNANWWLIIGTYTGLVRP